MATPEDWLSRLLALVPVRGRLDIYCTYGAPWRIDQAGAAVGEMAYHAVVAGSAVLEDPTGGPPLRLSAGDILLLPQRVDHILHDGSGAPAAPAHTRAAANLLISENEGTGERLDMLCGHFVLARAQERLLRDYLPPRLVVRTADPGASATLSGTQDVLTGLVSLMRHEAVSDGLGGRAMLNALSTALFTLTLRLASEARDRPVGLLALAGHSRSGSSLVGPVQRAGPPVDAAQAGAALQHVQGDHGAAVSGETGPVRQRTADGHPHDPGGERITQPVREHGRGGGEGRVPV